MENFDLYLRKFDLLSRQICLTSRKSEKFSTRTGVFASLSIMILVICLLGYYINKLLKREIQSIIVRNENTFTTLNYTFNDYLPYVIRIEDENSSLVNNISIININLYYDVCDYNNSLGYNCTYYTLNLSNCDLKRFNDGYKNYLLENRLQNAFCVDLTPEANPDLNGSVNLQGSWIEGRISYLVFSAQLCLDMEYCLPREDIERFLNNRSIYLSLYAMEETLDPQNYNYPGKQSVRYEFFLLKTNLFKNYYSKLTSSIVDSDIGWISERMNKTSLFNNDIALKDFGYITDKRDPLLGEFVIICSNKVVFVTRYYLKVQSILAFSFSIFNFLKIMTDALLGQIIDKDFYEHITQRVMGMNFIKDNKISSFKSINSNIKRVRSLKNNKDIQANTKNYSPENSCSTSKNIITKERHPKFVNGQSLIVSVYSENLQDEGLRKPLERIPFAISSFQLLIYKLCCFSSKRLKLRLKLLQKAKEIILGYTDIVSYINFSQQLEFFKKLHFSEKERKLFDIFYKQVFNSNLGNELATLLSYEDPSPFLSRKYFKFFQRRVKKKVFRSL